MMKILAQMLSAILLFTVSVYGQQRIQNVRTFADTVKETSRRPAEIIQEPTVLGVGKTWAVVSWTTNASGKGRSRIYAGTDPENLRPANETLAMNGKNDRVPSYAQQEYAHLVRLNNLKPGTTYYFKAGSGRESNRRIESESHTWAFTTGTINRDPWTKTLNPSCGYAHNCDFAKPVTKILLARNNIVGWR